MQKRVRTPPKLCNKSCPLSRLLFNDVELCVAPASIITLTLVEFNSITPW